MHVSRRDFLRYCTTSAAALGLSALDLRSLDKALADSANGRSVIWLQGSSCLGCSMSFLNRIATAAPTTAADALMNSVPLAYHTALMGPSGEMAVATAQKAAARPFILVVEGGVPTAFDGAACWAWTRSGKDVTFQEVAKELAARAAAILAVGTCAAYGGIPAAPPNPGEVKNVATATGHPTVNVAVDQLGLDGSGSKLSQVTAFPQPLSNRQHQHFHLLRRSVPGSSASRRPITSIYSTRSLSFGSLDPEANGRKNDMEHSSHPTHRDPATHLLDHPASLLFRIFFRIIASPSMAFDPPFLIGSC